MFSLQRNNALKHLLISIIFFTSFSCEKDTQVPLYHTWNSLGEMEYFKPAVPPPASSLIEEIPDGFFPWAGIASHHLLAHEYLDLYFFKLSQIRDVKCFYILSPDHNKLGLQTFSLTDGSWESGFGLVESDKKKVNRMAKTFNVKLNPNLFYYEHGTSTLMPYIKKHFPKAKAAVIAYNGQFPVDVPASSLLSDIILKEFKTKKNKRENFLLISADFSHRGDIELTKKRDDYSFAFLKDIGDTDWQRVYSDNAPGMHLLDRIKQNGAESIILFHTNSWEIANEGDDDITSYFFACFADK